MLLLYCWCGRKSGDWPWILTEVTKICIIWPLSIRQIATVSSQGRDSVSFVWGVEKGIFSNLIIWDLVNFLLKYFRIFILTDAFCMIPCFINKEVFCLICVWRFTGFQCCVLRGNVLLLFYLLSNQRKFKYPVAPTKPLMIRW